MTMEGSIFSYVDVNDTMNAPSFGVSDVACLKQAHSILLASSSSSPPPSNHKRHQQEQFVRTFYFIELLRLRLLLLCLIAFVPSFSLGQVDLSCDVQADTTCPTQNNGICESELVEGGTPVPGCETGDCFDCDQLCNAFAHDCESCLANGCYWCPGDATCYNTDMYEFPTGITACKTQTDYFKDADPEVCSTQGAPFSDPLYAAQRWVFDMINLQPVWETENLFGAGIRMRINDSGMNHLHPEFADRFDVSASCDDFEPRDGHGTSVAAIAAAAGNNGACSVGIAPEVTLSACYALDSSSWIADDKFTQIDIAQNSIGRSGCMLPNRRRRRRRRQLDNLGDAEEENGNRQLQVCPFSLPLDTNVTFPCDVCDFSTGDDSDLIQSTDCIESITAYCRIFFEIEGAACIELLDVYVANQECVYYSLSKLESEAFIRGTSEGRDGKGIIYVFASGNDFAGGDDVNFSQMQNTRFTISVGSVGKDELHASYSNPGSALLVCAPGGDRESVNNFATASVDGGCSDAGQGTSFACPVVSGVVALMLQANNELSWRDVQGILATTSRMVTSDPDDNSLITNAAGLIHSNRYGFGIVTADAAVAAARSWEFYGPELQLIGESGTVNLPIPDTSSTVISTVIITNVTFTNATLSEENQFFTESVEVSLNLRHFTRGDLDIILTSPLGTTSVLHPGKRPENTQADIDIRWQLVTVRNWNENPLGEWTLQISDLNSGDLSVCVDRLWHIVSNEFRADCITFERLEWCQSGEVVVEAADLGDFAFVLDSTSDEGFLATDACCSCGGGRTRADADFVDELVDWRLVVYGHSLQTGSASSPSNQTSSQPSSQPSQALRGNSTEQSQPPSALTNATSTFPSGFPTMGNSTVIPTSSMSPSQMSSTTTSSSQVPSTIPSGSPTAGNSTMIPTSSLSPSQMNSTTASSSQVPSTVPSGSPTTGNSTMIPTSSLSPSQMSSTTTSSSQVPSTVPSGSPSVRDGTRAPTSSFSPSQISTTAASSSPVPSTVPSGSPSVRDGTRAPTASLSPSQISSTVTSPSSMPSTVPSDSPSVRDGTRIPTLSLNPTENSSPMPSTDLTSPPTVLAAPQPTTAIQRPPVKLPPWFTSNSLPLGPIARTPSTVTPQAIQRQPGPLPPWYVPATPEPTRESSSGLIEWTRAPITPPVIQRQPIPPPPWSAPIPPPRAPVPGTQSVTARIRPEKTTNNPRQHSGATRQQHQHQQQPQSNLRSSQRGSQARGAPATSTRTAPPKHPAKVRNHGHPQKKKNGRRK